MNGNRERSGTSTFVFRRGTKALLILSCNYCSESLLTTKTTGLVHISHKKVNTALKSTTCCLVASN